MKNFTKLWTYKLRLAALFILFQLSAWSQNTGNPICESGVFYQTIKINENIPNEGSSGDFILYDVDPTTAAFRFVANLSVSDGPNDIAIPSGVNVNSLGINLLDGQLYFINAGSPYQLYRSDSQGNVAYLGNINGLSGANQSGVFDDKGNYYVTGGSRKIFNINVNTLNASLVAPINFTCSDISINPDNGLIYAWDQGKRQLKTVNLNTQEITTIGPAANTSIYATIGALYFLPSGQLIGYGDNKTIGPNGNSQESLIDIDTQTGAITQLGTGPSVGTNDGASCVYSIALDKDGPESIGLNDTMTYTFTIFNRLGAVAENVLFQDILQSGLVFNSDPYNITGGLTISGSTNGLSQADLVLNTVPLGVSTFQMDVFIDCDFAAMTILNQAIIGIGSLENPVLSNDTDTAVIGDSTGTGIQPLALVVPDEILIDSCSGDLDLITPETAVFAYSPTMSDDIKTEYLANEDYVVLPNADNLVSITYIDVDSSGSDDCTTIVERTFTATDECDKIATTVQLIKITDTVAPVPEDIPLELDLNCEDFTEGAPITDVYTALDNCNGTINGVPTDVLVDGDCGPNSGITRTWTFTDSCGNTAEVIQNITIVDTTPPVFDLPLPGDITADCNALPEPSLLTATDNCGEVTVEFEEGGTPGTCEIVRTWTATDSCGNSAVHTQTITVEDDTPPEWVLSDDPNVDCITKVLNGGFEATQFNGQIRFQQLQQEDILGWSTTASHNTIEIQRSGQVDGSPSRNGNYHFELNGRGLDDLFQEFCTVPESELTITFYHRKRQTNDITDSLELFVGSDLNNLVSLGQFDATNADGWKENILNYTVPAGQESTVILFQALTGSTPSVGNLLDDISVSSDRNNIVELPQDITVECDEIPEPEVLTAEDNCSEATVTFEEEIVPGNNPDCPNAYGIIRTWTATDVCGNFTEHSQTITIIDTKAPTFNENLPEDVSVSCGDVPNVANLTAFDSCGNASVVFEEETTDTGTCGEAYAITRTWTATDDCGNTNVHTQTISVESSDPAFNEELPTDLTIQCNEGTIPEAAILTPDNACGESSVAFEETEEPGDCDGEYSIVRVWTVSDDCGNETKHTQVITIVDTTPPTFVISDEPNACNTQVLNNGFESEQFNGDFTIEQVQQDNITGWSTTRPSGTLEIQRSGQVDGSPSRTGNYHFELNGVDLGDLYQEFCTVPGSELTIQFYHRKRRTNDITDSLELFVGSDINNLTSLGVFSTTNADGWKENIVNYTVPENQESMVVLFQALSGTTPSVGNLLDDISVSSDGNTFTELPQNITVECGDIPEPEALVAEDSCSEATVTVSDEIVPAEDGCANTYTIVRTWTAADSCGNLTLHNQNISVVDTKAPTFNESLPQDETVDCGAIPSAPNLTAFDTCGEAMVAFEEAIGDDTAVCVGYTILRIWTASDSCGNTTVHEQIITVQDTTAPQLTTPFEENITTACDNIPDVPALMFEDSCSAEIQVVFNEVSTEVNDFEDYSIIRTWTVTDDCLNSADYVQTITVEINNVIDAEDANRCILDEEFDLFTLLSGDFNMDGIWTVVSGIATLDGSLFDPSSVDVGAYTFKYAITEGSCPTEAEVTVAVDDDCVVLACGPDDVVISKTVTANGDAYNEFFQISGIDDCGFVIELQIYNRWGAKIYESNDYQNDWNGDNHGSSVGSSGKVPSGTYYYILNLRNSGLNPVGGPIYVATK